MEGLCWRCVLFWRCICLPKREFAPSLLCPVQPMSAAVPWWRLDKLTSSSHTHPPQSRAYQPRTGLALLPELAHLSRSERPRIWQGGGWLQLNQTWRKLRVVQTPKESEGGCFFFFILIFESLFKLNQREFTETAFMFPHSADERVF